MKRAGAQAVTYAKRPGAECWAHLVFGRDRNFVREVAETIQASLGLGEDPFSTTRLTDEDIKQDPARLSDELQALSLLGGARLVRVRCEAEAVGGAIARVVVQQLETGVQPAARLIVEAGDLSIRSALRKAFEDGAVSMALHLFELSEDDVAAYARGLAAEFGAQFAPEALDRFAAEAPRDRGLVRSEVEKLALYAGEGGVIDVAGLEAVGAGERSEGFDDAADAALAGAGDGALSAFDKAIVASGASAVGALKTLERRLLRLVEAHALMGEGQALAAFGPRLSPPVFRSEVGRFERVLERWPPGRALSALSRVRETEKLVKRAGAPDDTLIADLLLNLSRTVR